MYKFAFITGQCHEYVAAFLGQELQDDVTVSSTIKYEIVVTNPGDASADAQIHGVDGIKYNQSIAGGSIKTYEFDQVCTIFVVFFFRKSICFSKIAISLIIA